jgi:hypothetical protein
LAGEIKRQLMEVIWNSWEIAFDTTVTLLFLLMPINDWGKCDRRPFVTDCMANSCELTFGSLSQWVTAEGIPPKLQILGFVMSDKALVFASITPIAVQGDGFLQPLALSMIENDLDAYVFGDGDYLLRASKIPHDPAHPQERYLLLLCAPSKPLFDARCQTFSYSHFSFLQQRA